MEKELEPTMHPQKVRGPYTPDELETIRMQKGAAVIRAKMEQNTTVMCKITHIENKTGDIYTLDLGDGTGYMIDEYTAVGLVNQVKAFLKTRMP